MHIVIIENQGSDLSDSALCMYFACMPSIQIRDVSPSVHAELVRKAEQAGQSLQQFLSAHLTRLATSLSLEDLMDRVEGRALGVLSVERAIEALSEDRVRR